MIKERAHKVDLLCCVGLCVRLMAALNLEICVWCQFSAVQHMFPGHGWRPHERHENPAWPRKSLSFGDEFDRNEKFRAFFNGLQLKHDNLNGNIKICLISTFFPTSKLRQIPSLVLSARSRLYLLTRMSLFVPEIRRLISEITFLMWEMRTRRKRKIIFCQLWSYFVYVLLLTLESKMIFMRL